MTARLFCKTGELAGADYDVSEGAVLGSAPDNTIVVQASGVSRRDLRIVYDAVTDSYYLQNLSGPSGRGATALDGSPVIRKEKLGELHVITIAGQHDFIFHRGRTSVVRKSTDEAVENMTSEQAIGAIAVPPFEPSDLGGTLAGGPGAAMPRFEEAPAAPEHDEAERTQIGAAAGAVEPSFEPAEPPSEILEPSAKAAKPAPHISSFVLELGADSAKRETFPLKMGDNIVGRAEECDVCLPYKELSRQHSAIEVKHGSVTIRDMGSTNGTYVDGERLSAPVELSPGTTIRFGSLEGEIFWRD